MNDDKSCIALARYPHTHAPPCHHQSLQHLVRILRAHTIYQHPNQTLHLGLIIMALSYISNSVSFIIRRLDRYLVTHMLLKWVYGFHS
ncbi:hypothetical protein BU24DRAFT_478596 [Aaosphaeria arxii CBS 175.79]|uniref:Uncharacterized protein n=1 Tax=Aaosphaeria arxii CBS 175.79 TaxID=1450172 RepID=A0A6A5XW04_9PLEO|nr:uncharacterized protein BU24DRAFT_478596 [Aaosphaeria arxii CBS 175.79]KAF2017505.1 hypothetical protein BU24DRAFT_478596 [Aaosphaeria arxii CBS 175.79]